ncbi:MAG: ParB/RepB/Spo0J family partition protein [Patescibacteria group bacterium]|nr:ParB/RepB/Spo0J family partition protein [Patescibacteria group bacterium]MDD4304732.1 ParB/RepB/Spo0J family partition protein [Patescibacteria group bacterium]MDD4695513.1 ParB/RepB/Spo0J family partition protein [Patescibacteria group bacterium]
MTNKYGLGRGLSSLIPKKINTDMSDVNHEVFEIKENPTSTEKIFQIEVDKIKANPWQPRTDFDEDKLEDLMNSVREHGIIQPLIVTQDGIDGYELVAGERRLKAAKMLNLFKVPVIVMNITGTKKLELAIIENIQRQNLNLLEESEACYRLMKEFNLTQEEIAKKLGKNRSTIANILRLRNLPDSVRKYLKDERISFGHAKLLLSLEDENKQKELLKKILSDNLNVKDTSDELHKTVVKSHSRTLQKDPNILSIEENLRNYLDTKVKINDKRGKGSINIEYYSKEEMINILEKVLK